jgi:mycofactocin system glycosyltransferase
VVINHNARVIRHEESQGPAACRNIGAVNASGDILAFLDADCLAGENWLKETIPFFRSAEVGAVGGYVDGYYKEGFLDRYEAVASSLNMGKRLLLEGKSASGFYVPTANMLVAGEAFVSTGGFKAGMRLGEDVDFCWRLRNSGYTLLYVPLGSVAHKHRNKLARMLQRRNEYGTSEAVLYRAHRDKKKSFLLSLYAGLAFLALTLAVLLMNPYPLVAIPVLFGIDLSRRSTTMRKFRMALSLPEIAYATFRSYLSFFYYAFFHLVRYYLVLILALGFAWHPLWLFSGLGIVGASIADYFVKKPKLAYPIFFVFYLLEHLAYQLGVFRGCLKLGYFGSYLLSFRRT